MNIFRIQLFTVSKKIKAVIIQPDELVARIQLDQISREKDALSISLFKRGNENVNRSSTRINGEFIYSQLLVDILVRMEIGLCAKHEMIDTFKKKYHAEKKQLETVEDFEQNYVSSKVLWWYTRDAFLYRELNRALRTQDFDMLFLFRFFIRDIHQRLKALQGASPVCVYRGQLISTVELEILRQSIGEYISMNSFLSTTQDRHLAVHFLGDSAMETNDIEQRVLFEIEADPQLNGAKSFADIREFSCFPEEEETLFMLGAVFRLIDVFHHVGDRLWIIRMTLCSDHDHNLKSVYDYRREEFGQASILSFGLVLTDMGKFDMATSYFRRLLIDLPANHPNIAASYHALGTVAKIKGDYDASLDWYQKALALDMSSLQTAPDHPDIALTHNSLGVIYEIKGDFHRAHDSYNQALTIYKQLHGINNENHSDLVVCYSNLGGVHQQQNNYTAALECHTKALTIGQQHLPADHPHLAALHNNIGIAHWSVKHRDLAFEHFTCAISILEKTLPSQHPDIALTIENLAEMYEDSGEFEQALIYYEKAATIYRNTLPPDHPYRVDIEQHVHRVINKWIL